MPNGKEILNEMEFRQRIKAMPDRELLEFAAGEMWETCQRVDIDSKRIKTLEDRDTKTFGISGGIGGAIGGGIAALVSYLTRGN